MGLGVPREPVQLERDGGRTRLISINSRIDHAERMRQWSAERLGELAGRRISGFVLKSRSPSCGLGGVPVHGSARNAPTTGRGLFATALSGRFPNLPIEEETTFTSGAPVERFLRRARAYAQLQELFRPRWKPSDVIAFQTTTGARLRDRSFRHFRELSRLVAALDQLPRRRFRRNYETLFMRAVCGV